MYNLLELYWLNVNLNPSVQKRFHQINHQFISKPIPMLKCTVEVLNIIIVIIIIIIIIVIITIKKITLFIDSEKNRLFTDSRIWILKYIPYVHSSCVRKRIVVNDHLKTTNNNYKKHQKVNTKIKLSKNNSNW